jgi:DNA helicase HerA-like ATPase
MIQLLMSGLILLKEKLLKENFNYKNDERDIQAVLTGINNATHLRSILASLDSKKQALLLGHAVAMPVVVQTRSYDEDFYRAMNAGVTVQDVETFIKEIF